MEGFSKYGRFGDRLLICYVIRNDYRGNDSYPYRRHKMIRLKNVPTFGIWVKDRLEMPLEDDCRNAEAVEEVFSAKL